MDIEKIISEITKELEGNPYRESAAGDIAVNMRDIPGRLEHSMLAPDITREKILKECANSAQYGFAAICVAPYYVADAVQALLGTSVAVCSAVGFPHGAISLQGKIADLKECILMGAGEVDVSLNMLAVKSGDMDAARRDLDQVISVAQGKARIKAVFEHSVYTEDEKIAVLEMVRASGAPFVKIQNVLSGKAADPEDVRFVRSVVGRTVQIKIDGGVKTVEHAAKLLAAGADRIGLTASVEIAKACR
jgi:deoxyribose-phosphate aldolase